VTAHRVSGAQLTGLLLVAACKPGGNGSRSATVGWPAYGGDPGGARYSAAAEITPRNVARLRVAWTYRTGDVSDGRHWPSTTRFGRAGAVSLAGDVGPVQRGQYEVTSPPAVVNAIVVVGSAVGDNRGVAVEHGTVHGIDARTGALRWSWDPIPRDSGSPAWRD